jgi:hypothetical protein
VGGALLRSMQWIGKPLSLECALHVLCTQLALEIHLRPGAVVKFMACCCVLPSLRLGMRARVCMCVTANARAHLRTHMLYTTSLPLCCTHVMEARAWAILSQVLNEIMVILKRVEWRPAGP